MKNQELVHLYDRGRNVHIQIHATTCYYFSPGAQYGKTLYQGRWVEPSSGRGNSWNPGGGGNSSNPGGGGSGGQQLVTIYFANGTAVPANAVWVNGDSRQHYMTVPPGQTQSLQSYIGHVWEFSAYDARTQSNMGAGGSVGQANQVFRLGDLGGGGGGYPDGGGGYPVGGGNSGGGGSGGQSSGSNLTQQEIQSVLQIHNDARRAVGVARLQWSNQLAQSAQRWAETLAQQGQGQHGGAAGENIFWGTASAYGPADAARSWLSEQSSYGGQAIDNSNYLQFGHYTAMVWRDTTEIGVGKAVGSDGQVYIVAHYDPAGNMIGQRPY